MLCASVAFDFEDETIQVKAIEQYFPVVLYIMLYLLLAF